jgi:site-specific DNA-methyltransferase (adenine-specific)
MELATGLHIEMKKVQELKPYKKNPRINDGGVEACAESIKKYGFKCPIIIDSKNVIVAGHTRLKAAKYLKLDEVPCVIADDLTEEQIKAFRIADNKVSDFSLWDNKLLLEELNDIAIMDEDLFTGFNIEEITGSSVFEPEDGDNKLTADEALAMYEVVFKSDDPAKIERIKLAWEDIKNG